VRVTQRTPETLVVKDGPDILLGLICAGFGAFGVLIGWSQRPSWIFLIAGTVFAMAGLYIVLFAPPTTHRFERSRGLLRIDSKRLWQSERRELPLDHIADVVLNEKRVRGGEAGLRYWVEYVITQGERIPWSGFTSSKDDKRECIRAI
jgi:hypothetical protein